MPRDLLQSFIILIAAISAMLVARVVRRTMVRTRPAEVARNPPVAPVALDAGQPTPQEVVLAPPPTPMRPVAVIGERPSRRLNRADARKGIVLATILGPCWACSLEGDHRV